MAFLDRRDAGSWPAERLADLARESPIVIALPPGGVPVAFEVAQRLRAPLDVLTVDKLASPGMSEMPFGAIAEDGTVALNTEISQQIAIGEDRFGAAFAGELAELRRRAARFRGNRRPAEVTGSTVIVVSDGLDAEFAELAAVRVLRVRGAARIVVAIPVGTAERVAIVGREADRVVCHEATGQQLRPGSVYEDFSAVPDAEVLSLLEVATSAHGPTPGQMPAPEHVGHVQRWTVRELDLANGEATVSAVLALPSSPRGLVVFADGDGLSRASLRNLKLAVPLRRAGLATLLLDPLTDEERKPRHPRDRLVPLLAHRLEEVTLWLMAQPETAALPIGYLGASTGAAAALRAAADRGDPVSAVVSFGAHPDYAARDLARVTAPTLLVCGTRDPEGVERTRRAAALLRCPHRVQTVDGAGRLFAEPGTLETAAALAAEWFAEHLNCGDRRFVRSGVLAARANPGDEHDS